MKARPCHSWHTRVILHKGVSPRPLSNARPLGPASRAFRRRSSAPSCSGSCGAVRSWRRTRPWSRLDPGRSPSGATDLRCQVRHPSRGLGRGDCPGDRHGARSPGLSRAVHGGRGNWLLLFHVSVHDTNTSWFDTTTLISYRYSQQIHEPRYSRNRHYEIFPELGFVVQNRKGHERDRGRTAR